jgi:apolipoprotein N-acyltransferase
MNIQTSEIQEAFVDSSARKRNRDIQWEYLIVAGLIMLFANGRYAVAPAAWIAPALFVRYMRQSRTRASLVLGYLVLVLVWAFQFRGMAPLPGIWYWVLSAGYAIPLFVTVLVDQRLAPRLGGFRATLVLPTAWVACEYLVTRFSPYSSWSSIAYSQADNLILLQVLSLAGMSGLTFLIAWTAGVINWAWESGFEFRRLRAGLVVFVAVLVGTAVFGAIRLRQSPAGHTVRIASLSAAEVQLFPDADFERRAYSNQLTPTELELVRERCELLNSDLLARSEREARAGSKLVFWGETNAVALPADEERLISRAQDLARRYGCYLGLGLGVWHPGDPRPLENLLVMIAPPGKVEWRYRKARPVPPGELRISKLGDGRLRFVNTPFGQVGGAICFDMDFPLLLRQAGEGRADILIVPSNDWRAIDPWHTKMATYRAIEQGFNLVRHASGGLSLAIDAYGRRLAAMDHYDSPDRVMVSFVPTRRVATPYTRIGDLFAFVCMAGLAFLLVGAISRALSKPAPNRSPRGSDQ